jgi:hypothetical protein
MHKLGNLVHAPIKLTILGCLKASRALHSEMKSFKFYSLGELVIFNFLIATVHSRHFPLYIIPKLPSFIIFSN